MSLSTPQILRSSLTSSDESTEIDNTSTTYSVELTVKLWLECDGNGESAKASEDAQFVLTETLQRGMDSGFAHMHEEYVVSHFEVSLL